jgi:dihydroorotate dehydrogenase
LGCCEIIVAMDLYALARPILFAVPPETAHALALTGLNLAHRAGLLAAHEYRQPVEIMGLTFPNRLGLAAGLDKNATCIDALGAFGFGFIEVGTVTPRPQPGNERPRLFRLTRAHALINRLGFPNEGIDAVRERLRARRYRGICGVSIGKNATSPIASAYEDYRAALQSVYSVADYVAVNISSPNTAELRTLQSADRLLPLLSRLVAVRDDLARRHDRRVPILIKFTADVDDAELATSARAAVDCGVDGIIAVNTTTSRESVTDRNKREWGGLSGAPLLRRAIEAIGSIRAKVGCDFPLIGVGGIQSVEDAHAMRHAGADLVQIYTGLIYRGPRLIREILASDATA